MTEGVTVFVVDDDVHVRKSVGAMVSSMGLSTELFNSAEAFLEAYRDNPGCVVIDQCMPGISGLDLQEELRRRGQCLPVIVLTGKAHTQLVVQAMKNGAVTVLDKPCDDNELWQAIRDGLALDAARRRRRLEQADVQRRLESLTPSEATVLEMIIAGKANKSIASQLGSSLRTIESRRRGVFTKLGVQSVAELVATVVKTHPPAEN